MKRTWTAGMAAALAMGCSQALISGVVIEMVQRELPSGQQTGSQTIYAQGEMLRMDQEENSMIFRGNEMLVLDNKKKRYYRFDEKTIEELGATLNDAMKQYRESIERLPPAQREMAERMMKGQLKNLPGGQPVERRVVAEGRDQAGNYPCVRYSIYRDDEKVRELCTVSLSEVGAAAEAMPAFMAMARFAEKLFNAMPQMARMAENPFNDLQQIEGFPVLTREFSNGRPHSEGSFESAERQDLRDDLFIPPTDYKEEKINVGRGRR